MSAGNTQPYEALAVLIERELELVGQRDFQQLQVITQARSLLTARMPERPPAEARPVLERCRQLNKRVEVELLRVREALLIELAQVRQAQRAASGYAPVRQPAPRFRASA
jgi:hypothetical protein